MPAVSSSSSEASDSSAATAPIASQNSTASSSSSSSTDANTSSSSSSSAYAHRATQLTPSSSSSSSSWIQSANLSNNSLLKNLEFAPQMSYCGKKVILLYHLHHDKERLYNFSEIIKQNVHFTSSFTKTRLPLELCRFTLSKIKYLNNHPEELGYTARLLLAELRKEFNDFRLCHSKEQDEEIEKEISAAEEIYKEMNTAPSLQLSNLAEQMNSSPAPSDDTGDYLRDDY